MPEPIRHVLLLLLVLVSMPLQAEQPPVVRMSADASMEKVYPAVFQALENARFYVVFEPYISKNLQRFSGRWGDNYNRNQLDSIRSMVFCNAWYANEVSNKDPDMLGLCPLRIGLYEKQGKTYVLFARPSVMAEGSPAKPVLVEAETEVIEAIRKGLSGM